MCCMDWTLCNFLFLSWKRTLTLLKKWSLPLRVSTVNVTKSTGNCGFGHIYWGNPEWKTSFFVQCEMCERFEFLTGPITVIVRSAYLFVNCLQWFCKKKFLCKSLLQKYFSLTWEKICFFTRGNLIFADVLHTHTHFSFWKKQGPTVSFSNIRDIAFNGCFEIIWTRNFAMLTVYATIYGKYAAASSFF